MKEEPFRKFDAILKVLPKRKRYLFTDASGDKGIGAWFGNKFWQITQ